MRIAFLHPDMGIGGAEQLVVNLAMSCKQLGHYVKIFTPSYDPTRALEQIKDGTIDLEVRGNFFPRRIFGKFHALCEYIRVFLAAMYLVFFGGNFDVIVIDQIPLAIPMLNLRFKTFFYCHYPDKLLCTERKGIFKKIYRYIIDTIEEITMLFAHEIAVNSYYTQGIFKESFRIINKFKKNPPSVIYPCINLSDYDIKKVEKKDLTSIRGLESLKDRNVSKLRVIVSLNRYERKKNLMLAMDSYLNFMNSYLGTHTEEEVDQHILIIAGGFDPSLHENIEVYSELSGCADISVHKNNIFFLKNISGEERSILLKTANLVIYTPKNEHFGIVPVESMYCGAMVVAHKSGGPTESIKDGETGYLMDNEDQKKWGFKLFDYFKVEKNFDLDNMNNKETKNKLKKHVFDLFSLETMRNDMYEILKNLCPKKINPSKKE
jgi:alpha-1,3/alpha-1,6-mannosyltransferase